MAEELIGSVEHYFPRRSAAVVHVVKGEIHLGDRIHFVGPTTDFVEDVRSLEMEHRKVETAHAGEDVGVLVDFKTPERTKVFRILDEPTESRKGGFSFAGRDPRYWDPMY